ASPALRASRVCARDGLGPRLTWGKEFSPNPFSRDLRLKRDLLPKASGWTSGLLQVPNRRDRGGQPLELRAPIPAARFLDFRDPRGRTVVRDPSPAMSRNRAGRGRR